MSTTGEIEHEEEREEEREEDRRARLAELAHRLTVIPWCPWTPTERQRIFLLDFSKEVLYGGAVGGAKSVAALMGALQFIEVPNYAALLLRKSFADLSQPLALMDLAEQWFRGVNWEGKGVPRYAPDTHTWHFPAGSSITFGYIDRVNDHLKYQGAAYQYVCFDEVTQHQERHYRYLFSRLRKQSSGPISKVPLRMRATANPGGPGHEWVYKRFIAPHEAWLKARREGRDDARRPPRRFIPSYLTDNPHLDREAYLETLSELDPVTRAQLLKGDWNIRPEGRYFQVPWFKVVPDEPRYNLPYSSIRYWDMAATDEEPGNDPDYSVGTLLTVLPEGQLVVRDVKRFRKSPAESERIIRRVGEQDGRGVPVYFEQEPGAAGKTMIHHMRTKVLPGWQVYPNLPSGPKIVRAGPFASMADAGMVLVVNAPWNEAWFDELSIFPDGLHDDQVDSVAGAWQVLSKRPVMVPKFDGDDLTQSNPWDIDPAPPAVAPGIKVRVEGGRGTKKGDGGGFTSLSA